MNAGDLIESHCQRQVAVDHLRVRVERLCLHYVMMADMFCSKSCHSGQRLIEPEYDNVGGRDEQLQS